MQQPITRNFLTNNKYIFTVSRTPNLNYFLQSVSVPGMALASAEMYIPGIRVPYAGDTLEYDELIISFIVDEELQTFLEMRNWIKESAVTTPKGNSDLKSNIVADGTLIINSSNNNPIFRVTFEGLVPLSVSSLDFNTNTENDVLTCEATFRYSQYEIRSYVENKII